MKSKMEMFLEDEIKFVLTDILEEDEIDEFILNEIKERILDNIYRFVDDKIINTYYSIKEGE